MFRQFRPSVAVTAISLLKKRSLSQGIDETDWRKFWDERRPAQRWWQDDIHPARGRIAMSGPKWRRHHGHSSCKAGSQVAKTNPPVEFADGTPLPASLKRYGDVHWEDKQLQQIITAGAIVEELAENGRLPRIPSTREQRDWDPEVPLFLEDEDEHGPLPAVGPVSTNDLPPVSLPQTEEVMKFDRYTPSDFIDESYRTVDWQRPFWSRRMWVLSNEFLIQKPLTNRNTTCED